MGQKHGRRQNKSYRSMNYHKKQKEYIYKLVYTNTDTQPGEQT